MPEDFFNNVNIENIKNNFVAFYNTELGLVCVVLGGTIISCCLLTTICSITNYCRKSC